MSDELAAQVAGIGALAEPGVTVSPNRTKSCPGSVTAISMALPFALPHAMPGDPLALIAGWRRPLLATARPACTRRCA